MAIELDVTYRGEKQVLTVDEDDVITFPEGFIGFAKWRRFVLLEDAEEAPLAVLQSVDDPSISLLVTDPWHICRDYKCEPGPGEMRALGLDRVEDARILCTLAAKEGPVSVTANLLGPIIINPRTKVARQIVLQDSPYSVQHPVLTGQVVEDVEGECAHLMAPPSSD